MLCCYPDCPELPLIKFYINDLESAKGSLYKLRKNRICKEKHTINLKTVIADKINGKCTLTTYHQCLFQ